MHNLALKKGGGYRSPQKFQKWSNWCGCMRLYIVVYTDWGELIKMEDHARADEVGQWVKGQRSH